MNKTIFSHDIIKYTKLLSNCTRTPWENIGVKPIPPLILVVTPTCNP